MFAPAASQDECAQTSPDTGAALGFWHPNLVALHVWLHNERAGLCAGLNPLVRPFDES